MTLEDEVRRGYTIPAKMKKVWQVQMDLLKKLLDVCDRHHLRVWGDGGTMLGTVREHGYIPWDDDIDMVLLRPDYDKLVQIAPTEFEHPYFFQCAYTEKNYVRGHSQLRMDGTSAILQGEIGAGYHMGIFIDIFPYDAVPDSDVDRIRQIEARGLLLNKMFSISKGWDILHPFSSFIRFLERPGLRRLFHEYENIFRDNKIEDNCFISCLSFQVDLKHFLRDKHWYDETVYLPFEDMMMPLPKDYDRILKQQYGDYMIPKQAPSYHGGFLFINAEVSYKDYLSNHKVEIRKMKLEKIVSRIRNLFSKFKFLIRVLFLVFLYVLGVSSCEGRNLDVTYPKQQEHIINSKNSVGQWTIHYSKDSINAYGFAEFLKSFSEVHLSSVYDMRPCDLIIGVGTDPDVDKSLESINGHGYIIKTINQRLIIAGTDETWTALALYELEDYLLKRQTKEEVLIIPENIFIKEEFYDPKLIGRLIQKGYDFSLSLEYVLTCKKDTRCYIGQGATSDGDSFYIINKNSSDNQSILYKYDMETCKLKASSDVINTGHSNDLTYNPYSNIIVVSHGIKQGNILTLVDACSLSVISDITTSVWSSSVAFNTQKKIYAFSEGGTTLHFTDDKFNLIESFTRSDRTGHTSQGMGSDDCFIYFPMSGSKDNIIVVYDWNGSYVTTLVVPTKRESETLFYSAGEYYLNFNHSGSELYRLVPILFYSYQGRLYN